MSTAAPHPQEPRSGPHPGQELGGGSLRAGEARGGDSGPSSCSPEAARAAAQGSTPGLPPCAFPATSWMFGSEILTYSGARFSVASVPSFCQDLEGVHDPLKGEKGLFFLCIKKSPFLRPGGHPRVDSSTRWDRPLAVQQGGGDSCGEPPALSRRPHGLSRSSPGDGQLRRAGFGWRGGPLRDFCKAFWQSSL